MVEGVRKDLEEVRERASSIMNIHVIKTACTLPLPN